MLMNRANHKARREDHRADLIAAKVGLAAEELAVHQSGASIAPAGVEIELGGIGGIGRF